MTGSGVDTEVELIRGRSSIFSFLLIFWRWIFVPLIVLRWALGGEGVWCVALYHTTLVLFSATPFFKQHPWLYLPTLLLWLFLKIFNHLCHSLFAIYIKMKKSLRNITGDVILNSSTQLPQEETSIKRRLALSWGVVLWQVEVYPHFHKT